MIRTIIKYTDNKILLDDAEVFEMYKKLPPGFYDLEFDKYGEFKNFVQMKTPQVFPLMPSEELSNIEEYIKIFFSEDYEELCKSTKIHRKSGILFYGKAGIGKSNYFSYIMNTAIKEKNACVFNINSALKLRTITQKLRDLRNLQAELFIIVMEEMDELLIERGTEGAIKNLMDGVDSVNNSLFLASTNYIENIPKSLTERPSRFKKVFSIEQSKDTGKTKQWLSETYKIFIPNITNKECEELHNICINKTIDEIKHILIDYKLGITKIEKKTQVGFKK